MREDQISYEKKLPKQFKICMDLIETNLTESRLITPRNKINLLLLTTIVNIIGRQGAFEKKNVHQDVYNYLSNIG